MPEVPQQVVVNTTPIIALALIGKLGLLQHLYSEVAVPAAVYNEVLAGGASPDWSNPLVGIIPEVNAALRGGHWIITRRELPFDLIKRQCLPCSYFFPGPLDDFQKFGIYAQCQGFLVVTA